MKTRMVLFALALLTPACAPHSDLICEARNMDTGDLVVCTDYLAGVSDTDVIVACSESTVAHGPCSEGYLATCEVNQDGRSSAIRYYAPLTLDSAAGFCGLAHGTLVVR